MNEEILSINCVVDTYFGCSVLKNTIFPLSRVFCDENRIVRNYYEQLVAQMTDAERAEYRK
jgi:hypothetical protein